jgi:two-component system chemotaxis response regulator CheB
MRKAISTILDDEEIEIVGTASNGKEGIEKALELKPDIITMDIEMPVMTGLEALKEIMATNPIPIIMFSTLTSEGAESTMEALSNGAVDFITKKAAFKEMDSLKDELISKIKAIAKSSSLKNQINRRSMLNKIKSPDDSAKKAETNLIAKVDELSKYKLKPFRKLTSDEVKIINIGISTGGPEALKSVIPLFPADFPVPVFIEQHMPQGFTRTFSNRLNSLSVINVKEAEDGETPVPGTVYIAPGGKQMVMNRRSRITVTDKPIDSIYKPSVDVTMNSLIDVFGKNIVGVMMTGMGSDGSESYAKLSSIGGYIMTQEIESCVVAGMVKAVLSNGSANDIQSLGNIAKSLCSIFGLHLNSKKLFN